MTNNHPPEKTSQNAEQPIRRTQMAEKSISNNTKYNKTKPNSGLIYKISFMAIFCVCFLIGLGLIKGLVNERQRYHDRAIAQMKKVHAPDQQIITPFILFEKLNNNKMFAKAITPEKSNFAHQTQVTDKHHKIGIYKAISYTDMLAIKATYQINQTELNAWLNAKPYSKAKQASKESQINAFHTENTNAEKKVDYNQLTNDEIVQILNENSTSEHFATQNDNITNNQMASAKLILGVTDVKGLQQLPTVIINGKTHTFRYPKSQNYMGLSYVELVLTEELLTALAKPTELTFNIQIKGIDSLSTLALGENATVQLSSNWQDPKMFGITTDKKEFSKASNTGVGFTAEWFNPLQSVVNTQALNACINKNHLKHCSFLASTDNSYGIQFIQATNAYSLSDRTIKYAILLLMVIFGAFFLFEVVQDIKIHPVQYALVGAALLVFYVLVLSLSEQIEFAIAYLVAAVGCVLLISWYVFYVLNSLNRSLLFAGILSSLYGSFYYIIQSEDNSLIIGSVFMFVMIAIAMFFTRNIDWYEQA